ncbi:sulfotransferase family protein [Nocardioides sp. R-C-SC26]|uniref:sulfotransferase family protein n=1 Tax=Nocardioides sp. R-C-SC26 TaxID=2870414 RepID=UPI001E5EE34C|nr:sulfotransferase family protein [Nocardioides sp. R-C-SC26]
MTRRVLIVAGAGRSGTSTAAGSLAMLGLHVPQPEVPADETNPRGFYESQWVVDFHKELLNRDPVVRTLDARPEAIELAGRRLGAADSTAIETWLGDQLAEHPQVVVKDPRVLWFHDLWRQAALAGGAEVVFLTMLRHPVEVAKSRDTHYTPTDRGESFRRQRWTTNIAGWCNAAFVTEEVTRQDRRAFLRYPDLLADWRSALAPVVGHLGLEIGADLTDASAHHAVDDFIEPTLRRSETSWDDVDVPDTLRAVAEGVWEQVNALADDPEDRAAVAALATLRTDYGRLHDHGVAVALDHTQTREVHVRRRTRERTAEQYQQRIAELEAELAAASSRRGWWRR